MTTTGPSLLDHAQAILNGRVRLPPSIATRAAAFLARRALEDATQTLCRSAGASIDRATMRSQLVVVRVLHGQQVADTATIAWIGLSNACHHHAYELTPTVDEVRHWLALVAGLSAQTSAAHTSAGI